MAIGHVSLRTRTWVVATRYVTSAMGSGCHCLLKSFVVIRGMGTMICTELCGGNGGGIDFTPLLISLIIALTLFAICFPPRRRYVAVNPRYPKRQILIAHQYRGGYVLLMAKLTICGTLVL
nr:hypothetical protein JCGZ_13857 [Ipomoea batatas]